MQTVNPPLSATETSAFHNVVIEDDETITWIRDDNNNVWGYDVHPPSASSKTAEKSVGFRAIDKAQPEVFGVSNSAGSYSKPSHLLLWQPTTPAGKNWFFSPWRGLTYFVSPEGSGWVASWFTDGSAHLVEEQPFATEELAKSACQQHYTSVWKVNGASSSVGTYFLSSSGGGYHPPSES